MAITAPSKLADFAAGFLPPTMSEAIFEKASRISVVQPLVRRIPLGINGNTIPVVTARPAVGWVGEGEEKPKTEGAIDLKTITPKKLAAILVVSAEVVRANPGGYINTMRDALSEAFAVAFDRAVLHDEGPGGASGGGPFATYIDQTTKTVELGTAADTAGGLHQDFVSAMRKLVVDVDASGRRYQLNGWALDSVLEPSLWGAVDSVGHPIYVALPQDQVSDSISNQGRLLNRRSFMGEGVATIEQTAVVGYAGDWTQAVWGAIGGISYGTSTETSITINGSLVSLWEHNLLAIKAEAEYGWLMNDADAFVKLTNVGNVPVTSA